MSKNFEFMQHINSSYYRLLETIEQNARIKPIDSARNCRTLLEAFIEDFFSKQKIEKNDELYKNLSVLKGTLQSNPDMGVQRIGHVKYDVVDMHNQRSQKDNHGLYYIKDLANSASHEGLPLQEGQYKVIVSPEAVMVALRVFYDFFTASYKNQIKGVKPKFLCANVPLGEYELVNSYTPADSERSRCIKEYMAVRKTGEFSKEVRYVLLREYIPSDVDGLFLNRNLDAFSEAYSYIYSDGVNVRKLNKIEEPYANFYIAYEFVRPISILPEERKCT